MTLPSGSLLAAFRCRFAASPGAEGEGFAYSWTSSISVPNEVFGWTKATVVPREPGPGRLVDDPAAGVLDRLQRHAAVVHPVADVVQALALVGQVLGHGRGRR